MSDTIEKTVFFAASRETVWDFLTRKDKLAKWFHPADQDLREGENYALLELKPDGSSEPLCWGNVLEMVKPERLVYTFTVRPLQGAMTTVTWTLEAVAGGTRLSLRHEGVGAVAGEASLGLLMALDKGWDEHFKSMREGIAAVEMAE